MSYHPIRTRRVLFTHYALTCTIVVRKRCHRVYLQEVLQIERRLSNLPLQWEGFVIHISYYFGGSPNWSVLATATCLQYYNAIKKKREREKKRGIQGQRKWRKSSDGCHVVGEIISLN
ncbi:hypothetical protein TNCT_371601 [Trichonephila clavata]|uniref:Uncharacterized protein n=1 Tax=Trichonephila clavata TaxID=2740835 RepID=A0A8X6GQ25_TRICU|nr:hypothetical protein TNCT_371601 [Trichonephila clavata]